MTTSSLLSQEAMPIEIRAMRERDHEIKELEKRLEEKDEIVATLQGQMEMMRKQVIMMKTSMMRKRSSNNLDVTKDTETQTTPSLANGHQYSRSPSTSPSRSSHRRKQNCCTIS